MNGNQLKGYMESLATKKMIGAIDPVISSSIALMEILKNNLLNFSMLKLLNKFQFVERRFQNETTIKNIIIKTACTRFDSFHKHDLLCIVLAFYKALLH